MLVPLLVSAASMPQAFEPGVILRNSLDSLSQVQAVDVDGDGDLDVAIADSAGVRWMENDGSQLSGSFRSVGVPGAQEDVGGMLWLDDDGDGDADLIAGSLEANEPALARFENLGGGAFGPLELIQSQASSVQFALASDVDGDGDQDLVAGQASRDVVLYLGDGAGSYGGPVTLVTAAAGLLAMALEDIDGDGADDLLLGTGGGRVRLHLNLGGGLFGSTILVGTAAGSVTDFSFIDVDQDGDQDLVAAAPGENSVLWFPRSGGSLGGRKTLASGLSGVVALDGADMDGDGDDDLLCALEGSESGVWLRHLQGDQFSGALGLHSGRDDVEVVHSADLDGDGDPDTLFGERINTMFDTHARLILVENRGDGGVADRVQLDFRGLTSGECAVGDLDGDGDDDFVLGDDFRSEVYWVENPGDGGPGLRRNLFFGVAGDVRLGVHDVDADGQNDVIVGSGAFSGSNAGLRVYRNIATGTPQVTFLLNAQADSGAQFSVGDINGDGIDDLAATYKRFLQSHQIHWWLGPIGFGSGSSRNVGFDSVAQIKLVDVDTDGDADTVLLAEGELSWIESDGGALAGGPPTTITTAPGTCFVAGDFDGDGDADLVAGSLYLENLGLGVFAPGQPLLPGGAGTVCPLEYDWDGDGDLDLFFGGNGLDLRWIENLGGGSFGPPNIISSSSLRPPLLALTDLDRDQDVDLVSLNGSILIQRNLQYFGSGYCHGVVPGSTGEPAVIFAEGSPVVGQNVLSLGAAALPPGAFGYFLIASEAGFIPLAGGSQGNLCLGGQVGRFNRTASEIQLSDASGAVALAVDLTDLPSPTGTQAVLPGDTRFFQYWTRDFAGVATSNFTGGLRLEFR